MKKHDDGKLAESVRMAETLDTLGTKVDELSTSVDQRFEQVDQRVEQLEKRVEDGFTEVAEQFAEQRAYTEFAFSRLEKEMTGRFDRLERKLDKEMTGRFDRLERKLDQVVALIPTPRRRKRP